MIIETLIPIVMTVIGGLIAYAIGFGFGRRSAYKDVDTNLGLPKRVKPSRRRIIAKGLVPTQIIK